MHGNWCIDFCALELVQREAVVGVRVGEEAGSDPKVAGGKCSRVSTG